jgi:prophage maintenance system killer protein
LQCITAVLVFLEMNGVEFRSTNEAFVDTVLAVAEGTLQKSGIAEFFRKHSRA